MRIVGLIFMITALIVMLFNYSIGILLFGISLLVFGISNLKRKHNRIAYVYLTAGVVFVAAISLRDFL
ncbi:hypothetical protein [Terribacillus sp. DMT04]|uniref:hypothetical protein n=1 Tax=Terribacillus sp. DMT04 TaxID=2850441 RepID=UPI001C2CB14B|nr:hypothetical protein [Terribacillus sp. DMT04]QXE00795.1 hypothetical protein KS242_12340 [Terribacillus sp. DMT04]